MADINSYIWLITLFIIYGIFLCYDIFRSGTKIGFLAYIVATIPVAYLWSLGLDVLLVYTILFIIWDITLLRDLLIVYKRNKEYDDILLFLALGILVMLILSAMLPELLTYMKKDTYAFLGYFYLPDVYTANFGIQGWVIPSVLTGFRIAATFLVVLVILPMVLDIRATEQQLPFLVVLILTAIFIIPFLFLSYIWLPQSIAVLTPLFCVILFIILLLLTKGK